MSEDDDGVFAAMRAGALGYLGRGTSGADIVAAIRATAAGKRSLAPHAPPGYADLVRRTASSQLAYPQLRPREVGKPGRHSGRRGQRPEISLRDGAWTVVEPQDPLRGPLSAVRSVGSTVSRQRYLMATRWMAYLQRADAWGATLCRVGVALGGVDVVGDGPQ